VFFALAACQSSEPVGNRTQNPRLKRPLLCQLSYGPNDPEYSTTGKKWANWMLESGNWKLDCLPRGHGNSGRLPRFLVTNFYAREAGRPASSYQPYPGATFSSRLTGTPLARAIRL
jgi:hypothetical protein